MKENIKNIHIVGIGGVGCSSLAQWLIARGYSVSGSDLVETPTTQKLKTLGASIFVGHNWQNVGNAHLVVRTSAVPVSNEEVAYAMQKGLPVLLREQLLGKIFDSFKRKIAVCGTHGKTTACSMLTHVLQQLQVQHCAFVGGNVGGNNFVDGKHTVVAEACEYNASFLHLHPTFCLCLNVEFDHPDCYKNLDEVKVAFAKLLQENTHGVAVLPKELQNLAGNTPTVTLGKGGTVFASNVRTKTNGCNSFTVHAGVGFSARCALRIPGKHNVHNAIAVVATCYAMGLPLLQVVHALESFGGVERRWQTYPHNVVCDYAHHPTELSATLSTALSVAQGKVFCLFQPHTYTRTQALWQQFAQVFCCVHGVAFLPVYSAREQPILGVDSANLAQSAKQQGANATFVEDFPSAIEWALQNKRSSDMLLVLGAGNIVDCVPQLIDALDKT